MCVCVNCVFVKLNSRKSLSLPMLLSSHYPDLCFKKYKIYVYTTLFTQQQQGKQTENIKYKKKNVQRKYKSKVPRRKKKKTHFPCSSQEHNPTFLNLSHKRRVRKTNALFLLLFGVVVVAILSYITI